MNYSILGDSDCPLVQIHLQDGESVKIENGSMAYLSDVVLEGKMNSSKKGLGGVLGAIGRGLCKSTDRCGRFWTGSAGAVQSDIQKERYIN